MLTVKVFLHIRSLVVNLVLINQETILYLFTVGGMQSYSKKVLKHKFDLIVTRFIDTVREDQEKEFQAQFVECSTLLLLRNCFQRRSWKSST